MYNYTPYKFDLLIMKYFIVSKWKIFYISVSIFYFLGVIIVCSSIANYITRVPKRLTIVNTGFKKVHNILYNILKNTRGYS